MEKILLVGGGGRECAIASALKKGGTDVKLYTAMKNRNPQIARMSEDVLLAKETDVEKVVSWAKSKGAALAVVGPEDPLGHGLADALKSADIGCVGPTKDGAQLEVSKSFARNLMSKYKIPGLINYKVFSSAKEARDYILGSKGDIVVKPAGLTAGKGVKILARGEQLDNREQAARYAEEILTTGMGGIQQVIIEDRAEGVEFTVQAFCDGKNILPMPAVHDHKRAFENDAGPNTGGMGSYSDSDGLLPFITRNDYDEGVMIIKKTVEALRKEGIDYRGIIYGQFMATAEDVKVIEYNVRFGDPEAMNVLSVIESDFASVCGAVAGGKLPGAVKWADTATVCKYVVPQGYGTSPVTGLEVSFNEELIKKTGAMLYYAAVNEDGGKVYTTTSRTAGIVGLGESIVEAERMAEDALRGVAGHIFVRHDIGKVKNIRVRTDRMKALRKGDGFTEMVR